MRAPFVQPHPANATLQSLFISLARVIHENVCPTKICYANMSSGNCVRGAI